MAKSLFSRLLDAQVALMRQLGFPPDLIEADALISECREHLAPSPAFLSPRLGQIDKAIETVLRKYEPKRWSTRGLCQAVAMEPGMPSSKSLENYSFHVLRKTGGTVANRCFDPATGLWSWAKK